MGGELIVTTVTNRHKHLVIPLNSVTFALRKHN